MNPVISPKKRLIFALVLIFIIAVCLGSYAIRQNYETRHYVTLTMEDGKGHITHERVSQQRLEQINRDANKMYKDNEEQINLERKQKGLPPLRTLPRQ